MFSNKTIKNAQAVMYDKRLYSYSQAKKMHKTLGYHYHKHESSGRYHIFIQDIIVKGAIYDLIDSYEIKGVKYVYEVDR